MNNKELIETYKGICIYKIGHLWEFYVGSDRCSQNGRDTKDATMLAIAKATIDHYDLSL